MIIMLWLDVLKNKNSLNEKVFNIIFPGFPVQLFYIRP